MVSLLEQRKTDRMNYSERCLRNAIVLNLGASGLGQKEQGLAVGLSQQAVSRIRQRAALGLATTQKRAGATPRLTAAQRAALPELLKNGAESYAFDGDYWTHKRVKFVIEEAYGVVYSEQQTGRVLKSIGWTRQKPQKKDAQQDPVRVAQWKAVDLPALKKKR